MNHHQEERPQPCFRCSRRSPAIRHLGVERAVVRAAIGTYEVVSPSGRRTLEPLCYEDFRGLTFAGWHLTSQEGAS